MIPGVAVAQAQFDPRTPMITAVRALNMQSGLRSLVDPGDSASFDGTSQLVNDVSGAGSTIRRGLETTDTVGDMLWTGVAGRNSASDYFYGGGPPVGALSWPFSLNAWIDNLHVDGAVWAIAGWQYHVADPVEGGTYIQYTAVDLTEIGVTLRVGPTAFGGGVAGRLVLDVCNGSGSTVARIVSSIAVPVGQWSFYAVIINEAAGTYSIIVNDTVTTGALSFSSPSASPATNNLFVAPSGSNPSQRYHANAVWQGGAVPTAAQMVNLYNLTRPKFGV